MAKWIRGRATPAQVILVGFFLLIAAGTLLLMLPAATNSGRPAPPLDALFTATSATCVTGLVVHDTALYWSPFGQAVILCLIQTGGMGVVTMAVAVAMFAGRKISFKQRWVLQESLNAPQVGGIVRQTQFILKTALLVEGAGAVLLAVRFVPQYGAQGVWFAVFHSVSAFCNAGFDLLGLAYGPYASLTGYAADPLVTLVIGGLIVVGGLGFLTWHDVAVHGLRLRRYTLQSKLILVSTALLLAVPALLLYFCEFAQPQWADLGGTGRVMAALFGAVTPRTAGFATVDMTRYSPLALLLTILLMLTGGASGSTAGGFKVTTLAVLLLGMGAVCRHRPSAHCFGRRLGDETMRSALAIFMLYLLLFLAGGTAVCALDAVPLTAALFEVASAIGTVGLSLGLTESLGAASRCVLIFLMYFGRVGGLTLVYAVLRGGGCAAQYPLERVTVG